MMVETVFTASAKPNEHKKKVQQIVEISYRAYNVSSMLRKCNSGNFMVMNQTC